MGRGGKAYYGLHTEGKQRRQGRLQTKLVTDKPTSTKSSRSSRMQASVATELGKTQRDVHIARRWLEVGDAQDLLGAEIEFSNMLASSDAKEVYPGLTRRHKTGIFIGPTLGYLYMRDGEFVQELMPKLENWFDVAPGLARTYPIACQVVNKMIGREPDEVGYNMLASPYHKYIHAHPRNQKRFLDMFNEIAIMKSAAWNEPTGATFVLTERVRKECKEGLWASPEFALRVKEFFVNAKNLENRIIAHYDLALAALRRSTARAQITQHGFGSDLVYMIVNFGEDLELLGSLPQVCKGLRAAIGDVKTRLPCVAQNMDSCSKCKLDWIRSKWYLIPPYANGGDTQATFSVFALAWLNCSRRFKGLLGMFEMNSVSFRTQRKLAEAMHRRLTCTAPKDKDCCNHFLGKYAAHMRTSWGDWERMEAYMREILALNRAHDLGLGIFIQRSLMVPLEMSG